MLGIGPDASLLDEERDRLGRAAIARQIFRLATEAPGDWPVTLAVYGEWGSGKTTVLSFVRRLAIEGGHHVVFFNPWGYGEAAEMWQRLQKDIDEVLQRLGVGRFERRVRSAKAGLTWLGKKKVLDHAPTVAVLIPKVGLVAKPALTIGIPQLERWAKAKAKDLEAASEILKEKKQRIIVLVDDIDRARPDLVPEVLYALSEVFGLGGFTFVLAFDPEEVSKALKHTYGPEHAGQRYLEKIVNFPFWLPTASEDQIVDLIQQDLKQWAPFVPEQAIAAIREHLPRNPRAARRFVRLLNTLTGEIDRHRVGELDWPTLLRVFLLKTSWPRFAETVFSSEEAISKYIYTHGIPFRDSAAEATRRKASEEALSVVFEAAGIETEGERVRAKALLETLENRSLGVGASGLLYLSRLVENPTTITWKEFDSSLATWFGQPGTPALKTWILGHARSRKTTFANVARELFETCISYCNGEQRGSADALFMSHVRARLNNAHRALELMGCLAIDLRGFSRAQGFLEPTHFRRAVDMALAWQQFRGDDIHDPVRETERVFLLRLILEADYSPLDWIEALGGTDWLGGNPLAPDAAQDLLKTMGGPLATKAFLEVEEVFRTQGAIDGVISGRKFETLGILLDVNGVWKSDSRKGLISLFRSGNENVQLNLIRFLSNIANLRSSVQEAEGLAKDTELLEAMWAGATHDAINPRQRGVLVQIKQFFEKIGGISLSDPPWGSLRGPGSIAPDIAKEGD